MFCRFICIDVGSYGKNNDAGILQRSKFGRLLSSEELLLPEDSVIEGNERLGDVPYVFIGDEAFTLTSRTLRPFARINAGPSERIFNYRLSRARRIVESAFGLLVARWRVLRTMISLLPDSAVDVVKACCVLHNMVLTQQPTPTSAVIALKQNLPPLPETEDLQMDTGHNIRQRLKEYFNVHCPLPWQEEKIL